MSFVYFPNLICYSTAALFAAIINILRAAQNQLLYFLTL